MATVTILDDYQSVALASADWSAVAARYSIEVHCTHTDDRGELLDRLRGSEIVVAMRERTPFPADLLAELPELRLLVTTGMKNAAIAIDPQIVTTKTVAVVPLSKG